MEHYPLSLDGAEAGTLTVSAEGGWTWFEARCAAVPGIVRLSVYGEGREGYLGVPAPEGEGLFLRRRFSRSELKAFPQRIEYAARAGQPLAKAPTPEADTPTESEPAQEEAPPAMPEPAQEEAPPAMPEPAQEEAPPAVPEPAQEEAPPAVPEPAQEDAPPALEDVYWYASPDGALVCFDGERNLIALPTGDERIPSGPGGWPRTIEGREYVIYRTKDGRLVR